MFYWTLSPLRPLPKKPDIRFKRADLKTEQVAQGQYVVSDTRCPALHDCEFV